MNKSEMWERLFIILLAIVALVWVCTYSGMSGNVRMKIYYEEYPANSNVTQLVVDIGEGFSAEHVMTADISDVTELEIKKHYAGCISNLRIDFTDAQGKIKIKKFEIIKNGIILRSIAAPELNRLFFPMHDVVFAEESSGMLEIDSTSNDGYAGFSDEFVQELNTLFYIRPQEKCAMVFMLLFIVFIAWNRLRWLRLIKGLFERVEWLLERLSRKQKVLFCSGLFVIGVLYCYRNYILGKTVFVFSDVANDSFIQTYPNLYHYADLISQGQNIFGWDFAEGLGAVKSFLSVSVWDWGILFGPERFLYFMGISQILIVFVAYVIMYFYLKILGRKELTAHIGAMSYTLCGNMMVRQFWKAYPSIVVLTALVLLCLELLISRKNRKWLPLALFVYCTNLDSYLVCLMFAMMAGYTIFRYFQMNGAYKISELISLLMQTVGAYVIGLFASAVCVIPSLALNLGRERLSTGRNALESYLLSIADSNLLKTAFFRTISSDWCGYDVNFTGWGNIIIAPSFYCGVFMLALMPLAIVRQKKGQKISGIIAIMCCFIYVLFPGINYMLNGFAEHGFRLSSIWVYYIIIYFGTLGLDVWLAEGSGKLLTCSLVFLMIITSVLSIGTEFFNKSVYIRTMFILFFFVLLANLPKWCGKNVLYMLTSVLVLFDLFSNSYIFCDTPMKITKETLDVLYQDDIIEQIKAQDSDSFYRIEKRPKVYYCDSLHQNYYGTNQYSGYLNDDLLHFYSVMEIPRRYEGHRHVLSGLSDINSLYTLLSVKYIVADGRAANDYGLEECSQVNNKVIYKNTKQLPIGFCYENVIDADDFNQLSVEDKRKAILDCCILEQEDNVFNICAKNEQDYTEEIQGKTIPYDYDEETRRITFDRIDETEVAVFDFVTEGIYEEYCYIKFGNEEGELGSTTIGSIDGNRKQHIEFCGNEMTYIQLDSFTIKQFKDIEIRVYNKDDFYRQQNEYIARLSEHAVQNVKIDKNRIEGNVKNEKDSVLFFSIPYDRGWNIYMDGKRVDLKKVNYGFIGMLLPAGEHSIVLKYRIPYMTVSVIISVIGLVAMVIWIIYWRRQEREEKA